MPLDDLHLTVLEIVNSVTPSEAASLLHTLSPSLPLLTNFPLTHRTRLVCPTLSLDASALALSFLPAADEAMPYTCQHLRASLFSLARASGVPVTPRYVVPTAHLTIARFVTREDHDTAAKMSRWVDEVREINVWLEREFWNNGNGEWWIGGGEVGLECRVGQVWYGGGRTILGRERERKQGTGEAEDGVGAGAGAAGRRH